MGYSCPIYIPYIPGVVGSLLLRLLRPSQPTSPQSSFPLPRFPFPLPSMAPVFCFIITSRGIEIKPLFNGRKLDVKGHQLLSEDEEVLDLLRAGEGEGKGKSHKSTSTPFACGGARTAMQSKPTASTAMNDTAALVQSLPSQRDTPKGPSPRPPSREDPPRQGTYQEQIGVHIPLLLPQDLCGGQKRISTSGQCL